MEIDAEKMEKRLKVLEGKVEALEKQLSGPATTSTKGTKRLSAKEFLLTKELKSETQKVLALAYFLEHIEGMTSFNVPDLEGGFRVAKEKVPLNMNDAVNKNIVKGFIMEAEAKKDSKKAWYLTSTGERYVETELSVNHY